MTAKEYLKTKEPNTFIVPEKYLIEFARHHVEKALYQASILEQISDCTDYYLTDIIKRSILEVYPLANIK